MTASAFIERVILRNYRSIGFCDVRLGSLTYLVGPNAAGKSNFLDSLRLITDSLNTTLDHALRDRSGIKEVRRRSSGHPTHFTIELQLRLSPDSTGKYLLKIGAKPAGAFEVQVEECRLHGFFEHDVFYRVESGKVIETSLVNSPAATSDRLYLVNVSGVPDFRPVYDALSHMGFYNLNPDRIRDLQAPDSGDLLRRDGGNLASVLRQVNLQTRTKKRIEEFLSLVVPGLQGAEPKIVGPMETVEFRQQIQGAPNPWRFLAANMSDGTLRALGILVALFQGQRDGGKQIRLIGIEEPEVALHPAAAAILRDCLNEAAVTTQVIVTSHSPDLLDDESIKDDAILAVSSEKGVTKIGPIDDAGRTAIRDRLYTAGELLRMNQLIPDPNVKNEESGGE